MDRRIILFGFFFFLLIILSTTPSFAQFAGVNCLPGFKYCNSTVGEIITKLLPAIFALAGMLALLFLIWGGFKYMLAQGDPKQLDSAKNTITSAIIGLLVILLVAVIFALIQAVFKINIFSVGAIPSPAYAAGVDIGSASGLGQTFGSVGAFFTSIVKFAMIAAALVFLAILVWGGIRYLNAGGDQENVEKAQNILTNAVIGLLIVVLSLVIIDVITRLTSAATGLKSIFLK